MLILASASPRRQELLRSAGIRFRVLASSIAEDALPNESPGACAQRLAREKALAVAPDFPNDAVLGADTIVVVDGRMLGKPADAADAACMLRILAGRTHEVITGVCLVAPESLSLSNSGAETTRSSAASRMASFENGSRALRTAFESTRVMMSDLTDDEIAAYVASGEPMDKAGAYAIQGLASRWIPRIEGDYCNVVGLPVALVWRLMGELGVKT